MMTDRKSLPAVTNQQVAIHSEQLGSLVMRGLVAIREGNGPAKDNDKVYREARDVYNRTASYGFYVFGGGGSIGDAELKDVFQQLANNNYGKAFYPLSIIYFRKHDSKVSERLAQLAIEWCLANQTKQDVELWCDLGDMFNFGLGVSKNGQQAEYWYRKAAEQSHTNAQYYLGWMYVDGRGVTQDYGQAVEWYRKAAEQGHINAQYYLGRKYAEGRVVSQDYEKAAEWYRKAAEQGHASAQHSLGFSYKKGQGVPHDDDQVVYWYRKAAEQGDLDSRMYLESRGIDWRKLDAS